MWILIHSTSSWSLSSNLSCITFRPLQRTAHSKSSIHIWNFQLCSVFFSDFRWYFIATLFSCLHCKNSAILLPSTPLKLITFWFKHFLRFIVFFSPPQLQYPFNRSSPFHRSYFPKVPLPYVFSISGFHGSIIDNDYCKPADECDISLDFSIMMVFTLDRDPAKGANAMLCGRLNNESGSLNLDMWKHHPAHENGGGIVPNHAFVYLEDMKFHLYTDEFPTRSEVPSSIGHVQSTGGYKWDSQAMIIIAPRMFSSHTFDLQPCIMTMKSKSLRAVMIMVWPRTSGFLTEQLRSASVSG